MSLQRSDIFESRARQFPSSGSRMCHSFSAPRHRIIAHINFRSKEAIEDLVSVALTQAQKKSGNEAT